MATTAHYIVSDYSPEDRERLEVETGQHAAEADIANPWLTEKAFGSTKRTRSAPKFVAATVHYDPWSEETPGAGQSCSPKSRTEATQEPESIAGWYRTLARKTASPSSTPTGSSVAIRADTPALPSTTQSTSRARKDEIERDGGHWFISRALDTQARSVEIAERSTPATTSTLADILSRDPPPLPTEKPFTPPVWIALGPGNKGFEMLTKSGWEEGDALGKHAGRRSGLGYKGKQQATEQTHRPLQVKRELEIVDVDAPEIVDLTLSDDEYEDNVFIESITPPSPSKAHENAFEDDVDNGMDHNPRALLTPLPTVLKSDKLGIGLKAKTTGPYRESVKRVTHSAAALVAHIRRGEELKKMKKTVGRGRRGHDRMKTRDEEKRKNLLAYLNAD